MGAYPAVINKELDRYLPFLATTQILGIALKHGIGREKAHSIIKKYAIAEALRMREEGTSSNNLIQLLADDPIFRDTGITKTELNEVFSNRIPFLGNAMRQIYSIRKKAEPILKKYANEAAYEPGDIL
jgi:adenylosuccinate lyase